MDGNNTSQPMIKVAQAGHASAKSTFRAQLARLSRKHKDSFLLSQHGISRGLPTGILPYLSCANLPTH